MSVDFYLLTLDPLKTLAIIINYKLADLTLQAVRSVLDSVSAGPLSVVVVDNSEDKNEAERLRCNLPADVELLVSPENIGFGRACNLVFDRFFGEHILLLNPDARLLPECLVRLKMRLSSADKVAAVAPHVFWDEGFTFHLPPSYPPILFMFQPVLATWGGRAIINRLLSGFWRRHSIKVWRSSRPVKVNNLSGGHILLKREAVQNAGGLFDPRFFLYFEDTDLFLRLRKAGYTLAIEPRAEAVHYYDQCGLHNLEKKRSLMAMSHRIFLEKHCKGWKSCVKKVMDHFKAPVYPDGDKPRVHDFTLPFVLDVPEHLQGGWLFEWSPNPDFIPSVGRFGKGPFMDFPEECWAMMAPGHYFGRLGRPTGFGKDAQVVSWMVGKGLWSH